MKGWKEGKTVIIFKDGAKYTITTPLMIINGLSVGEKN
jgi:hypothetical protein